MVGYTRWVEIKLLPNEHWVKAVERWLEKHPRYESVPEATYVPEGDKMTIPVRRKSTDTPTQ